MLVYFETLFVIGEYYLLKCVLCDQYHKNKHRLLINQLQHLFQKKTTENLKEMFLFTNIPNIIARCYKKRQSCTEIG